MVVRPYMLLVILLCLPLILWGQEDTQDQPTPSHEQQSSTQEQQAPGPNQPLPRSTPETHSSNESSSRDSIIDLSPPENDAKAHPESGDVAGDASGDVGEFHPYDPHHAQKDIEVGDFYFKRQNYRAAIGRYREALLYKPNDAIATFSLAQSLEKIGEREEASKSYQAYLKILPHGPRAEEAHQALERLKGKPANSAATTKEQSKKVVSKKQ
jgi:tetratricopeptide (TPR) repeat protein